MTIALKPAIRFERNSTGVVRRREYTVCTLWEIGSRILILFLDMRVHTACLRHVLAFGVDSRPLEHVNDGREEERERVQRVKEDCNDSAD